MPLLKWAVASTHFPWQDMLLMDGLGDFVLWEAVGGEHGN